jgi:hypothetical protein
VTSRSWLRLYPPAWRERYGDEFADLINGRPLTAAAVIDIVSGAIDARLSSTARMSRLGKSSAGEGVVMIDALKQSSAQRGVPFTVRDGLIGAGLIVCGSVVFSAVGILLRLNGWPNFGHAIRSLAFPGSLMLAMPATWLKGQPWRAQVVIIGGTMAIVVLAGYLVTRN